MGHKKELVINARLGRGAGNPDVGTGIRDDRTRRIEIVRKTEALPIDLDFNQAQENKLRIFKAKEGKVYKPVQSMPILKTQHDKLKQQLKRTQIPKQLESHTLQSISMPVIMKYEDRPLKLRNHLPFAVDYENTAFHSGPLAMPEQDLNKVYQANIREVQDRLQEDLCVVGLTREQQQARKRGLKDGAAGRLGDAVPGFMKLSSSFDGEKLTKSQSKLTRQDALHDAPAYKEEDVLGLKLRGTHVYSAEKRAFNKVIDVLMSSE